MVFKPKGSFGWVWLVAFGAFIVASAVFTLATGRDGLPLVMWPVEIAIAALGVWFLALAAMFPTMRYEIAAGELLLRYGPSTWRVPLSSVREVKRTDLVWTMWSSMRFPGFALYNVGYGAGVGTVRMCATRAATGVLLIETDSGEKYGVTPADEAGFVEALLGRGKASAEV